MIQQVEFEMPQHDAGIYLITKEIMAKLPKKLPETGLLHLFVKHTSCAIAINENTDPAVRTDMEEILNHLVGEDRMYGHQVEGPSDMPSHGKSTLVGQSIMIPITRGRLNLGRWQGIYFLEFRDGDGPRGMVATIFS